MYTVSDQWDERIRSSGFRKVVVDVYDSWNGSSLDHISEDTLLYSDIQVESWDVKADRRSMITRTGSLISSDSRLVDALKALEPNPIGLEFKIRAGVIHPDGTEEFIPLGVFGIEAFDWSEGDVAVRVQLADRSRRLELLTGSTSTYTLVGRDSVGGLVLTSITPQDWLRAIFWSRFFTLPLDFDDTLTAPEYDSSEIQFSGSYLQNRERVAALIGAEAYHDQNGEGVLRPVPTVPPAATIADADWVVDPGEGGVLVNASRGFSMTDMANSIFVNGGPEDGGVAGDFQPEASGFAQDTDSGSLTSTVGPAGTISRTIDNGDLTTSAQCTLYAETILDELKGVPKSLSVTSVMNPAIEPGDIIGVTYMDGSVELHLVDTVTFDDSWSSQFETRAQRVS